MNSIATNNEIDAKRSIVECVIEILESEKRVDAGEVSDLFALSTMAYNNAERYARQKELLEAQSKLASINDKLDKAKKYMANENYDAILQMAINLDLLDAGEIESAFPG